MLSLEVALRLIALWRTEPLAICWDCTDWRKEIDPAKVRDAFGAEIVAKRFALRNWRQIRAAFA